MGGGQSCCFCLVWAKIKPPKKRLPSIFIPPGMQLQSLPPSMQPASFLLSPYVRVCVCKHAVVGTAEVNEVDPPFFLSKMKETSLGRVLTRCHSILYFQIKIRKKNLNTKELPSLCTVTYNAHTCMNYYKSKFQEVSKFRLNDLINIKRLSVFNKMSDET